MANTVVAVKANRIPLGSAKLYVVELDDTNKLTSDISIADALKRVSDYAKDENILGRTKNGATANYSATHYTEKDDFGEVSKTIVTDENFSISAGLITFDHEMVNKLVPTAEYTKDDNGNEMTKIGGIQNDNGKLYLCILVHEDKKDGDIIYMIHGKNVAALAWAFAKGAGTMTNPTIQAEPFDTKGRTAILLTRKSSTSSASGETETTEPTT